MVISRKIQYSEVLTSLFKALIKFGLKISSIRCQFFNNYLIYNRHTYILKDAKASYIEKREKCDAIINLQSHKSVKKCRSFCSMVNILSSFLKDLKKTSYTNLQTTEKEDQA